MGLNQTAELNPKTVVVGAAAIQYTLDNFSSFVGIGLADGIVLTETITPIDGEPDNGPKPRRADGIASQTITTAFNMWESDMEKIAAMRGGIDIVTNTAGTLVPAASQVIATGDWAYDVPFELTGQNATGLVQTITSVTGSVDGLLVTRTDYASAKTNNKWGIAVTDSTTVTTEEQTMTVVYSYTPVETLTVSTGGIVPASRIGIRMTNKTVDQADASVASALGIAVGALYWDITEYDIYYCIVNVGETFTAKNKDDTSPTVTTPFGLIGESDPDRSDGDNLYIKRKYNSLIS